MKSGKLVPQLRDRIEVDIPGRGIVTGEVRGKCHANGIDLIDVMLDGRDHEIVVNIPTDRIVVRDKVAA